MTCGLGTDDMCGSLTSDLGDSREGVLLQEDSGWFCGPVTPYENAMMMSQAEPISTHGPNNNSRYPLKPNGRKCCPQGILGGFYK